MFWIKRKEIVVDAFINDASFLKYGSPVKASEYIPEWFKLVPKELENTTNYGLKFNQETIRQCIGFNDLYKEGFILPLWQEVIIETDADGKYIWVSADLNKHASDNPLISDHPKKQWWNNSMRDVIHLKINSPWKFVEKTGIKFMCIEPSWNHLEEPFDLCVLPGIVQFNAQHSTNINMLAPCVKQRIEISLGTPMWHVIPLSEHKVEIKNHLLDDLEYSKMFKQTRVTFKANHILKRKSANEPEKKCPFGFGK
jgi:hypothetical protein